MLSAHLFDEREGKKLEAWVDALHDLGEGQLLWLDLVEASAEEEREVGDALGLDEVDAGRFREEGVQAAERAVSVLAASSPNLCADSSVEMGSNADTPNAAKTSRCGVRERRSRPTRRRASISSPVSRSGSPRTLRRTRTSKSSRSTST